MSDIETGNSAESSDKVESESNVQVTIDLHEYMQGLTDQLRTLSIKQELSDRRFAEFEKNQCDFRRQLTQEGASSFGSGRYTDQFQHPDQDAHNPTPTPAFFGEEGGAVVVDSSKEYDAIRESLQKVKLPNYMRVADSQLGIARDQKGTLKVVSKCARFAETGLRWISKMYQKNTPRNDRLCIEETDLQNLFHILLAQVGFLQGEYTNLVVQSTFDDSTGVFQAVREQCFVFFTSIPAECESSGLTRLDI